MRGDIDDIAADWSKHMVEGDLTWAQFSIPEQASWVKAYVTRYDCKITAQGYARRNAELKMKKATESREEILASLTHLSPSDLDELESEFPREVHEVRLLQLNERNLPPQRHKQALIDLANERRSSTTE